MATVAQSRIMERLRRKLHDETAPLRWSDAETFDALNDALRTLWSRRPDAFATTTLVGSYSAVTEPTASGSTLPVADRWVEPLACRMAGVLLGDDSDRADPERGARFLAQFEEAVRL